MVCCVERSSMCTGRCVAFQHVLPVPVDQSLLTPHYTQPREGRSSAQDCSLQDVFRGEQDRHNARRARNPSLCGEGARSSGGRYRSSSLSRSHHYHICGGEQEAAEEDIQAVRFPCSLLTSSLLPVMCLAFVTQALDKGTTGMSPFSPILPTYLSCPSSVLHGGRAQVREGRK